MPPKLHVAEIFLGAVMTTVATILRILGTADATERQEMNWLLLPFLGSLVGALCVYMLNPREEDRKTIGGRLIGGMFFGSVSPNVLFYMSETLQKASVVPAIPLTLGFLICSVVYILIKKIYGEGFTRADDISERVWDKLEDAAGLDPKKED